MSSVHGHRGHSVSTRSSPARRGRSAVPNSLIPVGAARIRPSTLHRAPSTTRQNHGIHAPTAAAVSTRRNTAPTLVARVDPIQHPVGLMQEVVDLTCNSPQRSARHAQLPVVLGIGVRRRVPAAQPKPAAKPNLRKRPTAAAAAVDVSPTKKFRNLQDLMCPICFDDISLTNPATEKPVFSTNCGHLFCKPCILACLERSNSCPICRKFQTLTDIHPIYINEKF